MGKNKSKKGGNKKLGNASAAAQKQKQKVNQKKAKNVFKVSNAKSNNLTKKTKEVPIALKKINVKDKQQKADERLKDLHLTLVTKKQIAAKKATPKKGGKKAAASTKNVQQNLEKMQV